MSSSDGALPEGLQRWIDLLSGVSDRSERIDLLIDVADGFREVPPSIAERPFPEENRVPACESAAFVWAVPRDDGRLDFHFAVENPQGISARALATLLSKTASGAPLERVASLDESVVDRIFGEGLSARKSLGLGGMIGMVRGAARRALSRGGEGPAPSDGAV